MWAGIMNPCFSRVNCNRFPGSSGLLTPPKEQQQSEIPKRRKGTAQPPERMLDCLAFLFLRSVKIRAHQLMLTLN